MPFLRSILTKVCLLSSGIGSLLLAAPSSAQYSEVDFFQFSDIRGHWAQACLEGTGQDKLISGYLDSSFRPDATMTRAEFAAVIVKAFPNAPVVREAPAFSDVPQDFWGADAIQTAYERGFLAGYPGNLFRPAQAISRVQGMVIISNAQARLGGDASADSNESVLNRFFADESAIPNYARSAIADATRHSLIVNYPNVKQLRPNDSLTRGEATALLCRLNEDGSDGRHYVAADYVAAFGYDFNAAGLPIAARSEPVALQSIGAKLDNLLLWEGIEIGEDLFFLDDETDVNLWKTDGTVAGTQLVRSLATENEDNPDSPSTWAYFAGFGDERLWMLAQQSFDPFEKRIGLWSSDGTPEGTREVADFDAELAEAIAQSEDVRTGWYPTTALNEQLPILLQNRTTSQLWITDGYSDAGTQPLATFSATTTYDNGFPSQQIAANDDYLFFIATANERSRYDLVWTDLWRTDGTPEGTLPIQSFSSIDPDSPLLPWQNRIYFVAQTPETGEELWTSDGTTAGTRLLKDIYPGTESASTTIIGRTEESLFMLANSAEGIGLWKTAGTPESTQLVKQLATERRFTSGNLYPINSGPINSGITDDGLTDDGLTDGGKFFFSVPTHADIAASLDSFELWVSDGTSAGTQQLGEHTSTHFGEAVSLNGQLFFRKRGASGEELWVSDGTVAGTRQLVDLTAGLSPAPSNCPLPIEGSPLSSCPNPGYEPSSTSPRGFMVQGDLLYFIATHNRLFRTDGTVRGTELVSRLDGYNEPSSNATQLGDKILFMSGYDRSQLWVIENIKVPVPVPVDFP